MPPFLNTRKEQKEKRPCLPTQWVGSGWYDTGRDILTNVEDVSFTGGSVTISPDETKARTLTGSFVHAGSAAFANDNYHSIKSQVASTIDNIDSAIVGLGYQIICVGK